jgi:alginate O-acetyltransferase complex protein AlgI
VASLRGDFSGYSDIARGSAQLMGFHFMVNFRQPYLSRRLQEFWRRWHISLSTWLRDYLYIPLGGSAGGGWKTSLNLLTTMVLAGLWHGAAWTFVIFGAIHGVVLSAERYLWPTTKTAELVRSSRFMGFASAWGQRILTFNVFCLSLAFFRAPSLSAATQFLGGMSDFAWRSEYASAFAMLALFAIPLFIVDLLMEASNAEYPFANASYALRTALATAALLVLALLSGNNLNAFVYFRF